MNKRAALITGAVVAASALLCSQNPAADTDEKHPGKPFEPTPLAEAAAEQLLAAPDSIVRLTEQDFIDVADSLGVEVAAIKAIVDIEAGRTHEGFAAPGKPLINFDLTMFRRFASRRGVNLAKYSKSHSVVFASHRGSQPRARRRLEAAKTINHNAAIEGTFWGMFQIGGFNWRKCGATSLDDFEARMSRSERDQLDMFANFIRNSGLLPALRNKNWAKFARGYNGPSYAKRRYHTRMAEAYARHSKNAAPAAKK